MRQVLREIIAPLVIGNTTTVYAFVALVPLKAAALRDLGIFSALILIGTILFVVVYLPHTVRQRSATNRGISVKWLDWLSGLKLENNRWAIWGVVLLTAVFAYFSFHTGFDANMSHINFMTSQQREDMVYFKELTSNNNDNTETLFVVSTGSSLDEAIDNNATLLQLFNKRSLTLIASTKENYSFSRQLSSRQRGLIDGQNLLIPTSLF